MAQPAYKLDARFTWDDSRLWPDDERWELIGGKPFAMSPGPTYRHQAVSMKLGAKLAQALAGRRCEVLAAPMDVKLSDHDVVQPDLLVVCDPAKIRFTHIEGPPELVVEIASEGSVRHDRIRKLNLYARSGVKEYWLITPYPSMVEVLVLDGQRYEIAGTFHDRCVLESPTLPAIRIPLNEVFVFETSEDEPLNEIEECPPPYPQTEPAP